MTHTRKEIEDELTELLTSRFSVPAASITPRAHLFDDLGLDSVDLLSAVAIIEERHDLTLGDDELPQLLVFDGLVDHLTKLLDR